MSIGLIISALSYLLIGPIPLLQVSAACCMASAADLNLLLFHSIQTFHDGVWHCSENLQSCAWPPDGKVCLYEDAMSHESTADHICLLQPLLGAQMYWLVWVALAGVGIGAGMTFVPSLPALLHATRTLVGSH